MYMYNNFLTYVHLNCIEVLETDLYNLFPYFLTNQVTNRSVTPAALSVSARLSKPVYCARLPQEAQRKINGLMNSVFDEYEQYSR